MKEPQKPSVLGILLSLGFLFACCLAVGALAFFLIIWGADIGHLDCGNHCSSAVAPYHSSDGLAQVVYWGFALLGALPLVLTSKKTMRDDKFVTLVILGLAALLGGTVTLLAYSYMLI
ncbi:MAG TPA: hypothetical protein VLI05_06450 [Candidatus Saccharimonadia bacterium]|nr:hypothetical protein [Candidatus Saccharimonadia bacterium]